MATKFARIRRRVDPSDSRSRGTQTIGKTYPWNTNTKSWSPTSNSTKTYNFNLPYVFGEVCMDFIHKGPPYREGDPFKHLEIRRIDPYGLQGIGTYIQQTDGNPSNWQKYVGGFAPPGVSTIGGVDVSNVVTALSEGTILFPDISAYGSKAWSKSKPKLEKANLFVTVAELRDLPRMLRATSQLFHAKWKALGGDVNSEVMTPKGLADQFLNEEFGWVPFLKDLRQLYAAFHGSADYMKRVTETNGRAVRRRATIEGIPVVVAGPDGKPRIKYEPTVSDTISSSGVGQVIEPGLAASYFTVSPSWTVREIVRNHVTASGKFTFYRPEFDTGLSEYNSAWFNMQRQLTMYGARMTPSNIYRATPWTWLIDWFTNVGEHFDLLTDMLVDSITANYLFLNQRKRVTRKFSQVLPFHNPGTVVLEWEYIISTNERIGANTPYGFSLTWENLTPRQLAILAALGISRQAWSGG